MIFSEENITSIISRIEAASKNNDKDYFCLTRDVFAARIDTYVLRTNNYLESAIIGEIGNNTFDHNWDFAEGYLRGTYLSIDNDIVVLADFGRGIKKSLEVVYKAKTDEEAVKVAFTEHISGRTPEKRGNGLKFVLDNVKKNNWSLYFQSGTGCCEICDGTVTFKSSKVDIVGCLAILGFSGEKNES